MDVCDWTSSERVGVIGICNLGPCDISHGWAQVAYNSPLIRFGQRVFHFEFKYHQVVKKFSLKILRETNHSFKDETHII